MSKKPIEVPSPALDVETGTSDIVPEKQASITDADKAANFLINTEGYTALTPEAEKRLKRKIDWIMIPMASSGSMSELSQFQNSKG